jgi:hypothetical protein
MMRETTPSESVASYKAVERRLIRSYLSLFLIDESDNGTKTISLMRHGDYEVRMSEFTRQPHLSARLLWLELYAHNTKCGLDSCGCDDLEGAVLAADELMSQARQLHEQQLGDRSLFCNGSGLSRAAGHFAPTGIG